MSIKSDSEFAHLQVIGRIVRKALDTMAAAVRPGVTTAEPKEIGSRVLSAEGARSAPPLVYGFPGDVCISVNEVKSRGFSVLRELAGHGVGGSTVDAEPHEEPSVPNCHDPRDRGRLSDGLVITIEPIIAAGEGRASLQPDRWTVVTADRSLSAHDEHTIVITRGAPILLTTA
jgi:methionine aminopeptidase